MLCDEARILRRIFHMSVVHCYDVVVRPDRCFLVLELVPDGEEVVGWEEAAQWPFEPLCAELRCSLFHAAWPRRWR